MTQAKHLREEYLEKLRACGIQGANVYLIDIIPLIEMVWADGKAQEGEIAILEDYLANHVDRINKLAGYELMSYEKAHDFVMNFLNNRPDKDLLKTLRSLVSPLRLSSSDDLANEALRESLLAACLDIAASSVVKYPYGMGDRFNPKEKKCFFEIIDSLQ